MLFTRHGDTLYTEVFPDLTDKGARQIRATAEEIHNIVRGRNPVVLFSSPSPRALGTASIIARRLQIPEKEVRIEVAIRPRDHHVLKRRSVESAGAIQDRFFTYLGRLFELFVAGKLPEVLIHVSHYEVLRTLSDSFGLGKEFHNGELVRLDLSESTVKKGGVHVHAMFRQRTREFECAPDPLILASLYHEFGTE